MNPLIEYTYLLMILYDFTPNTYITMFYNSLYITSPVLEMNGDEDSEERTVLLRYSDDNNLTDNSPDKHTTGINDNDTVSDTIESGNNEITSISDALADKYEAALQSTGFGLFSIFLLTFCGVTLMADTTEILCVSFVIPSAEKDLCLSDWMKGLIGSVIFVGTL